MKEARLLIASYGVKLQEDTDASAALDTLLTHLASRPLPQALSEEEMPPVPEPAYHHCHRYPNNANEWVYSYTADQMRRFARAVLAAARPMVSPHPNLKGLAAALRAQRQVDEDGAEVGVSRQAVDEAATIIESMLPAAPSSEPLRAAMSSAPEAKKPPNTCKLTECQGKPRCKTCLVMDGASGVPAPLGDQDVLAVAQEVGICASFVGELCEVGDLAQDQPGFRVLLPDGRMITVTGLMRSEVPRLPLFSNVVLQLAAAPSPAVVLDAASGVEGTDGR
jgi:hypothetical protein